MLDAAVAQHLFTGRPILGMLIILVKPSQATYYFIDYRKVNAKCEG